MQPRPPDGPESQDRMQIGPKSYSLLATFRDDPSFLVEEFYCKSDDSTVYRYKYGQYDEFAISDFPPKEISQRIGAIPEDVHSVLWFFESSEGKKLFDLFALRVYNEREITDECVAKVKRMLQIYAKAIGYNFLGDPQSVKLRFQSIEAGGKRFFGVEIIYPGDIADQIDEDTLVAVYNSGSKSLALDVNAAVENIVRPQG